MAQKEKISGFVCLEGFVFHDDEDEDGVWVEGVFIWVDMFEMDTNLMLFLSVSKWMFWI